MKTVSEAGNDVASRGTTGLVVGGRRGSPIIQGKRLFGPISLPVVYYETSFAAESLTVRVLT